MDQGMEGMNIALSMVAPLLALRRPSKKSTELCQASKQQGFFCFKFTMSTRRHGHFQGTGFVDAGPYDTTGCDNSLFRMQ